MPNNNHDHDNISIAMADGYSAEQMQQIIDTVQWRANVLASDLERQIDQAARWYAPYCRVLTEESRPSERERRLVKARDKLFAAAGAVRALSLPDRDYIERAGEILAIEDGMLPDVKPERIPLPLRAAQTEPDFITIWDAEQQIEASRKRLDWLLRCFDTAVERTRQEKAPHGSKPAKDALHTTIRLLHKVYFDSAADPRGPGTDIGDDSAESRTYRKGELLDFLETALQPLGITKSREAIYADWRRALAVQDAIVSTRQRQGAVADPSKDT